MEQQGRKIWSVERNDKILARNLFCVTQMTQHMGSII